MRRERQAPVRLCEQAKIVKYRNSAGEGRRRQPNVVMIVHSAVAGSPRQQRIRSV
jgi:hypothetical protein